MPTEQRDREFWSAIYKALKQVQSALGLIMSAIATRWNLDGVGNLKSTMPTSVAMLEKL